MKRGASLSLSFSEEEAVAHSRQSLWEHEDLTNASRRTSVSDLRYVVAWDEAHSLPRTDRTASAQTEFNPHIITISALIRYRASLQNDLQRNQIGCTAGGGNDLLGTGKGA
jgi:hypothetical protein